MSGKLQKFYKDIEAAILSRKHSSGQIADKYNCTKEAILYFIKTRGLPKLDVYPRHTMEERLLKSIRMQGHSVSAEARNKISKALTGNKNCLGKKNMLGKKMSLETRIKMSETQKKRVKRGSESPLWKGGVSTKNYEVRHSLNMRIWRESVFSRDNFTCQECNVRGGSLHAHHINSFAEYPDLRFSVDNGKTMCVSCHGLFHKRNLSGLYWRTK